MNEIYAQLRSVENTVNELWPYVTADLNAKQALENCQKEAAHNRSNYIPAKWMLRICLPLTVVFLLLFFLLPTEKGIFNDTYRSPLAIISGVMSVVPATFVLTAFILSITYGKRYKAAMEQITILERRVAKTTEELRMAKIRNAAGLGLSAKLGIPSEALDPLHMRMLLGYIEKGRVSTLSEALSLIEVQLHREQMERLQQEQIQATKEAAEAARRAAYRNSSN